MLAGGAAAGGVGVYGLLERLTRHSARRDWAEGGEARALIDGVSDPMAVLDRYGVIVAANSAASHPGANGRKPTRAHHLLGEAPEPEQIVYRLLGAALSGRATEATVAVRGSERAHVAVWPIGGGLALWRQSAAEPSDDKAPRPGAAPHRRQNPARRGPDAAAAGRAPLGEDAPDGSEIGWFRLDAAGRIIESDRIFKRWLGARGARPTDPPHLRTVLPEALIQKSGAEAARSRLIGAAGAPREVAVVIAPLGRQGERVGVASPAAPASGGPATAAPSRTAAPMLDASLFEAAPYGLALLDEDGRIRSANLAAERMFAGLSAEGLGGERPAVGENGDLLADWIAEKDADRVRRAFTAAKRGDRGAEATLLAEWASRPATSDDAAPDAATLAEPREVELTFRAHPSSDGPRRIAVFLDDASERRGLERNVAQAQKLQAVGELAGGVAHDFNNMLTVIIGGCEALTARKTNLDPDVEELTVITQSARRAATLVSQLLAYSRKQRLEPTVANLTEVVSDLSLMLNRLLGGRCFLQRDLAEDLWPVLVDVNQLGQAVTNLVVNARDAMAKGGKIIVRTRNVELDAPFESHNFTIPPGAYVRLDVVDEGPGVPAAIQEKIFEPFFTTKKVGQGTGLGLSMVYGMVKQSQGYVLLKSSSGGDGEKSGAAFSIYLPRATEIAVRAAEEAATAAAQRAEAAATMAPGDKIILLVEDEAAVRSIAAKALDARGYEVIEACDGAEALEILRDESVHVDLMLSDVVMPDVDGPSLLKQLGDKRPAMRTVFMTGYARDSFAETLEDAFAKRRAYGVLQKPFSLDELLGTVAEALGADEPERDNADKK